MINYTDKGYWLTDAIHAAGHWLRCENGEWVSSDDVVVQALIDSFDPAGPARAAKWAAIQAERDRLKFAGVSVGGNLFHSDPDSRTQQIGLVILGANIPAGLQWKTKTGAFVTMTPTLAGQIFAATAASDTAIFAAAETHRSAIGAMSDWQQIAAYDFSAGWPG